MIVVMFLKPGANTGRIFWSRATGYELGFTCVALLYCCSNIQLKDARCKLLAKTL